ncbi:hypothetical protein JTE90_003159 [Oedothorax gibbosus]|uniref:INO80 complex subunit E N-terminal domain-containing protein n=1 Tax=Oedothorax gibbosus TaxID=931172 RepID=A0AAV6U9W1_9ARAC|nr:hypothetical protein JTE90_003159 [Oedothorax gibbosus]
MAKYKTVTQPTNIITKILATLHFYRLFLFTKLHISKTATRQGKMLENHDYSGQSSDTQDYRKKYLRLKRKFKFLLYENESFQTELKSSQRKLLRISRDKSFLLDELMRYENTKSSSSDTDATISSDSDGESSKFKKKSIAVNSNNQNSKSFSVAANSASKAKPKKSRKVCPPKTSS